MPYFSVVITVFNKEDYIQKTLESVINQTLLDFEIIVVNDGSTDKSLAIINSFKDKRLKIISTENQGASMARNIGIKASSHNYIALLDGDDLWDLNYLKFIDEAIQKFPERKIFAAAIAQKYEHGIISVKYSFKQEELFKVHNYFEASKKYDIISSSSVVFNKSILKQTGTFDFSIVSGQDIDLWIRFGLFFDVVFINKQLVLYNYNRSSLSNTTFMLDKKPKFDKYFKEEKSNKSFKAYLDRNRYAMAILSKLQNDKENFNYYSSKLDHSNLSLRQNFLLKSPKYFLEILLKVKSLSGEKIYYSKD